MISPLALRSPAQLFILLFLTSQTLSQTIGLRTEFDEKSAPGPAWIQETISSMTIEEKVGQLIMARTFGHFVSTESDQFERLVDLVENQNIGGFVAFQGDVYELAVLLNRLQERARIPLLVAADFERGVAMRIRRATYFPDAMAIGATRNPDYAYRVGKAIAVEARAIGVHQNLAPVADVNNNPENPVINTRSFGEDPELVAEMVEAFVKGTNDGGAISTVKHFPGHGDTGSDSHIELPVLPFDRDRLDEVELPSFRRAIESGVGSVMIAHLAVPAIDSVKGRPATLSHPAVTQLLRTELGFDGLVVTDAMEMRGILNSYSIGESAVLAIQAGIDIVLVPADEVIASQAIIQAVESGEIPEARIDESVLRVLRLKYDLGLTRSRIVDLGMIADRVGTDEHDALAKQIARDAITVLKNEEGIIPLGSTVRRRVALVTLADSEYGRVGVNRPSSQMTSEPYGSYFSAEFRERMRPRAHFRIHPGSNELEIETVLDKIKRYDLLVVGVFAKVRSGQGRIGLPSVLEEFIDGLSRHEISTVVLSFGNPYIVEAFPEADALICAYSDAEVMVESAVEAMFGEVDVSGRLPVTIPDHFSYGEGIELPQSYLRRDKPAMAGFDEKKLRRVDSIVTAAIEDGAFPGAQLAVIKDGSFVYGKSFGTLTYDLDSRHVTNSTLYDIASLTKVVGTTAALMKLYDEGKIDLDDEVVDFLPEFRGRWKEDVTVQHLLSHTSGLPAYRDFFRMTTSPTAALDSLYATELIAAPGDTAVYSDLGMILLGRIVETVSGYPLDAYLGESFYSPLGMSNTIYLAAAAGRENVAPTETDSLWRMQTLQGRVHDENADLLGGVSGHSGLFSTASNLAVFMQMMINGGTYGQRRYIEQGTIEMFTKRVDESGTRALGWDTKSGTGSSAGSLFSSSSYGHTGFTGTSIWVDPERDLAVIFLTNRVHPTRENRKISHVRPLVHDAVIRSLNQ